MTNRPFRPAPFRKHPDYHSRLARIEAMLDSGHSHRDISRELGLSRQRVTQLIKLLPVPARSAEA